MALELSQNVLWHGVDTDPTSPDWLTAGPVATGLEEGQLRGIYLAGRQVVQRIYGAVRDRYWNTVSGVLTNLEVERTTGGFRVTFTSEHISAEVDFVWRAEITGTKDGTIRYVFDGESRKQMFKNRVGLCVLLPLSLSGKSCGVEYVSGDRAESKFPVMVDPMQPVRGLHDFRELRYAVNDVVELAIGFEGDVFEIEDQRNWTDASFKVYSTPQRIPLPGKMAAGQRVRQVVTFQLSGKLDNLPQGTPPPDPETVTIELGEPVGQFAGFGVGTTYHGTPLTEREVTRLKYLHLTHYHVEVDPQKADWLASLRSALREAEAIGTKVSVSLPLSDDPEMEAVPAYRVSREFPELVQWWLFFTRGAPASRELSLVEGKLCVSDGETSWGGGTDADFFQLNNNRPPQDEMLFVSVPLRPCAHQFDRAIMVENLAGQRAVLKSMAALWPGLTRTVTPVSFRTRAQKGPAAAPGELPAQADVRQMSLFGAGWTMGCVKAIAESGGVRPTLFQTTGLRGIMELESGSAAPREFHSIPGGVYPVYIVMAAMGSMLQEGWVEVIAAQSDAPLTAEAFVLKRDSRWRVLLANYTAKVRRAVLKRNGVAAFATAQAVVLDSTNAVAAMKNPEEWLASPPQREMSEGAVVLPPFAVAWVDLP